MEVGAGVGAGDGNVGDAAGFAGIGEEGAGEVGAAQPPRTSMLITKTTKPMNNVFFILYLF